MDIKDLVALVPALPREDRILKVVVKFWSVDVARGRNTHKHMFLRSPCLPPAHPHLVFAVAGVLACTRCHFLPGSHIVCLFFCLLKMGSQGMLILPSQFGLGETLGLSSAQGTSSRPCKAARKAQASAKRKVVESPEVSHAAAEPLLLFRALSSDARLARAMHDSHQWSLQHGSEDIFFRRICGAFNAKFPIAVAQASPAGGSSESRRKVSLLGTACAESWSLFGRVLERLLDDSFTTQTQKPLTHLTGVFFFLTLFFKLFSLLLHFFCIFFSFYIFPCSIFPCFPFFHFFPLPCAFESKLRFRASFSKPLCQPAGWSYKEHGEPVSCLVDCSKAGFQRDLACVKTRTSTTRIGTECGNAWRRDFYGRR